MQADGRFDLERIEDEGDTGKTFLWILIFYESHWIWLDVIVIDDAKHRN